MGAYADQIKTLINDGRSNGYTRLEVYHCPDGDNLIPVFCKPGEEGVLPAMVGVRFLDSFDLSTDELPEELVADFAEAENFMQMMFE